MVLAMVRDDAMWLLCRCVVAVAALRLEATTTTRQRRESIDPSIDRVIIITIALAHKHHTKYMPLCDATS